MKCIGLKHRPIFMYYYLNPLLEKNKLFQINKKVEIKNV